MKSFGGLLGSDREGELSGGPRMSRLDGTLTEIWLRHDIGGLILRAPIGLACCFSRLAGRGHLERPYQKGSMCQTCLLSAPLRKIMLAREWVGTITISSAEDWQTWVDYPLRQAVPCCMLSHHGLVFGRLSHRVPLGIWLEGSRRSHTESRER